MAQIPPFDLPGKWYKGSLHTHSTQSDGKPTPAENMQWHAEHGYDFVGITDHNTLTDPFQFMADPPLLAIPGVEVSTRRDTVEYHVLGIGVGSPAISRGMDPQAAIDAINGSGGLAVVAHPYWHDLTLADLLALERYAAIEIFNTGCWLEINKGHSLVHWDGLLRRGQRPWGLATDDSHFRYPDHGLAWVVARSEALDTPSLLDSLRKGQFYSTMGPEIHDVQMNGREVTVRCSPARTIFLIGDIWHCPKAAQAWDDRPLTEATFTLHPAQQYLRVEVVDMNGRSAWTNPFWVENTVSGATA